MAWVNYTEIAQEIKAILEADPTLGGDPVRPVKVDIEPEHVKVSAETPWVEIRLVRRDAPDGMQPLAGGKVLRQLLRLQIACWEFSFDGLEQAGALRDRLLGRVETALQKNHTLNDLVITAWITGGEFETAPGLEAFLAKGTIDLIADVKSTTE